ncbi:hypothetical protein IVA98_32965 [Bradyrhizobium sp. 160]|uniref:hypothetical protein n=1 Tax=unclassified Bradyrhizobium TaxID=2631580 RepID=UPI001FF8BF57|nr:MULTISPECIES: hypothetical protein [unclassified Bradyrhizobium]MCK1542213.1 hypothetical protein [Bradyrhizobium sp. 179]MCK1627841.1 hypothetical protein [Bradyrhizobium sp. 160]
MAPQLFKFLKSAHLDNILIHGTIRISTLSYFRAWEGGRWIGDPNEATTTVAASGAVVASKPGETVSDPWTPPGFGQIVKASDGGKVIFSGGARIKFRGADRFIFCVSQGERDQLVQAMCRDAEEPYDAAVRILLPLELLAHRIFYRSTIVEFGGEPTRWFFASVSSGSVAYDADEHHHSAGLAPAPSAFRKDRHFAAQSEARIVLTPHRDLGREWLTVKLPHPEKLFVEEFRIIP